MAGSQHARNHCLKHDKRQPGRHLSPAVQQASVEDGAASCQDEPVEVEMPPMHHKHQIRVQALRTHAALQPTLLEYYLGVGILYSKTSEAEACREDSSGLDCDRPP